MAIKKRKRPHTWPKGIRKYLGPKSYKSVVDWFQNGLLKLGNPDKPHSLFDPSDECDNAVVINNRLCHQLQRWHPDPPVFEYQVIESLI